MESQEIISFMLQVIAFYGFYKFGQHSIIARLNKAQHNEIFRRQEPIIKPPPKISVEQINGIYYAFDGNDFLAQASTPEELGQCIAKRYPDKYKMATIKVNLEA